MTKIGDRRTSTIEQNLDSPIIALKAAKCDIICSEQRSGNTLTDRKELMTILEFIHQGESLCASTDWPAPPNIYRLLLTDSNQKGRT